MPSDPEDLAFIFVVSDRTVAVSMERRVFALPKRRMGEMSLHIAPQLDKYGRPPTPLYVFNKNKRELQGPFYAAARAEWAIDPEQSKFPAQIRIMDFPVAPPVVPMGDASIVEGCISLSALQQAVKQHALPSGEMTAAASCPPWQTPTRPHTPTQPQTEHDGGAAGSLITPVPPILPFPASASESCTRVPMHRSLLKRTDSFRAFCDTAVSVLGSLTEPSSGRSHLWSNAQNTCSF